MQAILIYLWKNNSKNNTLKNEPKYVFLLQFECVNKLFFNKDNSNTIYNVHLLVS